MKRSILSLFSIFSVLFCYAQDPMLTSLNENFDLSCASVNGFPTFWRQYAVAGTQTWQCTQGRGLNNSPCISMNDYTNQYNADTVWLISPRLDLHTYQHVYLNFFDKYARSGDTLTVYATNSYGGSGSPLCDSCSWNQVPINTIQYDTVWKEHQIDITFLKDQPVYIAFVYRSSTTEGSIWYVDSVFTTTVVGLNKHYAPQNIPLTVVGMPGSNGIDLEYTLSASGTYELALFDITGRKISHRTLVKQAGIQKEHLQDLGIAPGMYIIKLGNQSFSGYAKAVVQ